MMNVLNGGAHADNKVDFQEFMVVPGRRESFTDCLRTAPRSSMRLKKTLHERGTLTAGGDEGGFAPDLESNQAALDVLIAAIEAAGYEPGEDVMIAMDPATSELFENGSYVLEHEGRTLSPAEMADYWHQLVDRFPIVSLEDGMDEEDWDGWKLAHREARPTAPSWSATTSSSPTPSGCGAGSSWASGNSILVKLNQIGTLTETLEAIQIARDAGYTTVISHRSGETEDTTIADLAVGTGAGQIKTGAPSRSDRVAKYNRLLRIEEELGDGAGFPGASAFARGAGRDGFGSRSSQPVSHAREPPSAHRDVRPRRASLRIRGMTRSYAAPGARQRRVGPSRVRWDRLGRIALVLVLFGVLVSYLNPLVNLFDAWQGSKASQQHLTELERENAQLTGRLPTPPAPPRWCARRAGWAWSGVGEHAYVVHKLGN